MSPPYRQYIIDYFRKIYAIPHEITFGTPDSDALIRIPDLAGRFFEGQDLLNSTDIPRKNWQGQQLPVLFSGKTHAWFKVQENYLLFHDDLIASAFYWLSGWQEFQFFRRHHALRYPYDASLQKALGTTHLPLVNYYFEIIKAGIESLRGQIPGAPDWQKAPFAICLTHDIDRLYNGWLQDAANEWQKGRIKTAAKIVMRKIGGHSDAFNLREISEIESRYGATASYYFIPSRATVLLDKQKALPHPRNPEDPAPGPDYFFRKCIFPLLHRHRDILKNADYDFAAPKLMAEIQTLRDAGSESGLHGQFGTSIDAEALINAANMIPHPPLGGRFHYLHFDPLRTFGYLDQAGLKYDSTLGFAEQPGFRHGTTFPFYPYNFEQQKPWPVLEVPLIAMDTTYRSYLGQEPADAKNGLLKLLAEAERFGGCLTLLWHNNYFTNYKFAGWSPLYEEILREGKNRGAWMTSAEKIYQCWLER